MNKFLLFLFLELSSFVNGQTTFINGRNAFHTQLLSHNPAPQGYHKFDSMQNQVKLVHYESAGRSLQGLLETTNIRAGERSPAVLYLHGGFALAYSDIADCKPFTDAGFVVFSPTYRGENGNSGDFEMFMGEVDDAKEAIYWLAKQPFVNPDSIFIFGHSIGGAMALSLSLHPDLPIKKSGGNAGIYLVDDINYRAKKMKYVPFNHKDKYENLYRLPFYSLAEMVRPHFLYIGNNDNYDFYKNYYNEVYFGKPTLLRIYGLNGDHFTSLRPSMELFIWEIKNAK